MRTMPINIASGVSDRPRKLDMRRRERPTWQETSLCRAEQSADDHEAGIRADESHGHAENPPYDGEDSEP
jgi:hypothetical protein